MVAELELAEESSGRRLAEVTMDELEKLIDRKVKEALAQAGKSQQRHQPEQRRNNGLIARLRSVIPSESALSNLPANFTLKLL
jgi:hypothetical protein